MTKYFGGDRTLSKEKVVELLVSTSFGANSILYAVWLGYLYTVIGGQRANGYVNLIMNRIKAVLLVAIGLGIFYTLSNYNQFSYEILMPDFTNALKSIGLTGLITNIFINISWQFVDNSSWQIISSGCDTGIGASSSSLKRTGLQIFLIYAVETFLGASLRGISGLDSDNVLSGIAYIIGGQGNIFFVLCIVILLLLSMMSLIDGMSLSVAQTIMVDLNFGEIIKRIKPNRQSGVQTARIITLFLGALTAWGIQFVLTGFGKSIFDFVYVFTIVQLSLIGPIIMGLVFQPKYIPKMWVSIIISLILGFLFNILGNAYSISWLCDVAGTVTAVNSFAISGVLLIVS